MVIEMVSFQELQKLGEERGLQIVDNNKNHIQPVITLSYTGLSQSGNDSYTVSNVVGFLFRGK